MATQNHEKWYVSLGLIGAAMDVALASREWMQRDGHSVGKSYPADRSWNTDVDLGNPRPMILTLPVRPVLAPR